MNLAKENARRCSRKEREERKVNRIILLGARSALAVKLLVLNIRTLDSQLNFEHHRTSNIELRTSNIEL
jgi:hypothetical protein